MRWGRHLVSTRWALTRRFPPATLDAIESAVKASEAQHRGEIRVAIEAALDIHALRRHETPRERAQEVFSELRLWDTRERNGVLIYLLLAERVVEIVADRGFEARVTAAEWRAVCAAIEAAYRDGRWRDGALLGIDAVTRLLVRAFPRTGAPDVDEQPNRPQLL
ncbi:MAG TPA: TPM domain-containing protein [Gammaproteobacteria bacterium]|nr:TPM domain-containing protein [Gammaproteobacteria bacterium]